MTFFLVSETKHDSSFPVSEFAIPGYRISPKVRNQHRRCLIFYMKQNIPSKTIYTFNFQNNPNVLPYKINLKNKKDLLLAATKHRQLMVNIFWINYTVLFYRTAYDNFLLPDLNNSPDNKRLKEFCNSFSLGHLIKTPSCYMGTNPSSIDHLIANMTPLFMKSFNGGMGTSDHHIN